MDKGKQLGKIAKEIAACDICKKGSLGKAVPGAGNPNAKVVFVGEAPGRKEAQTGLPFIGRSGQFLRQAIKDIGLDDVKDVYIMSPVKYLPKQGTPTVVQISHGRIHFQKQLEVINPTLIILMGRVAIIGALGKQISVAHEHGKVVQHEGRRYFVTYHPAAAMRFPEAREGFKKDFKKLKKLVK